ncbi:DnaJ-domain-containing protein [Mucor ambiguus]|uniref:DnaJ-domain-containing protein n=1 Tax=Mucor ambiguus TaxID=91626 RepID=A0A0C9LYF8_9FUNG|nr:DnaJ-domain-containing protein [Mucor ambiguus]
MFLERNKTALQIVAFLLLIRLVIPPVIRTWNWREDEFKLFELATDMSRNQTNFYQWLGIEPTADTMEIGKAHRQLVLKLHPETSAEIDAKEKFEITNQVAYILRSPVLRPLYDSILDQDNSVKIPMWKGFAYLYQRHRLICMAIFGIAAMSLLEYIKAWDNYMTEKLAFDHFVSNAKLMAQKISDKHATAKTHKSFIDLGNRTIKCEITPTKEIFIFNEKNERVPLSSTNLLQKPNILNTVVLRIPIQLVKKHLLNQ